MVYAWLNGFLKNSGNIKISLCYHTNNTMKRYNKNAIGIDDICPHLTFFIFSLIGFSLIGYAPQGAYLILCKFIADRLCCFLYNISRQEKGEPVS